MSNKDYVIRCPHCYTKKVQLELPFFGGEFVCDNASCPGDQRKFWCTHFPSLNSYVSFKEELDFFASIARDALDIEGMVGDFLICDNTEPPEPEEDKRLRAWQIASASGFSFLPGDLTEEEIDQFMEVYSRNQRQAQKYAEQFHKRIEQGRDVPKIDAKGKLYDAAKNDIMSGEINVLKATRRADVREVKYGADAEAEARTCPECKGSGKYVGFTEVEECQLCEGAGEIDDA